jgi:adenosylmethionine---8-amino-7-oxononanoate aminotransferase
MPNLKDNELLEFDRNHIWHPYSSMTDPHQMYRVVSASGVRLMLDDGRELIDGMSSWWSAIHGYNHPVLNKAVNEQIKSMSHVMFGGLTHKPAIELASLLIELTPEPLQKVFFCDSGSVSVEVAIKMAIQYWYSKGKPKKSKLLTIRSGYHGDTFYAMSVCDPVTGMHEMFREVLPLQFFADAPVSKFGQECDDNDIASFKSIIEKHNLEIAAVILEPVVQGVGGMRFYSPGYLRRVRELCDKYSVLLILDEIATGFGRTGKMFACEHAGIAPDIMCVGKAMTGGYVTLAATLTTESVSRSISASGSGAFMHGPTFMANPLACAVAVANIKLLLASPYQTIIKNIENQLKKELNVCTNLENVKDVRALGAIGVVELNRQVNLPSITKRFVERGVWIRSFGKLVYIMPPYLIEPKDLSQLTNAIAEAIKEEG